MQVESSMHTTFIIAFVSIRQLLWKISFAHQSSQCPAAPSPPCPASTTPRHQFHPNHYLVSVNKLDHHTNTPEKHSQIQNVRKSCHYHLMPSRAAIPPPRSCSTHSPIVVCRWLLVRPLGSTLPWQRHYHLVHLLLGFNISMRIICVLNNKQNEFYLPSSSSSSKAKSELLSSSKSKLVSENRYWF